MNLAQSLDIVAPQRHGVVMARSQRTTVYLEADLHRALRLKAAETGENLSGLINSAIREALAEDLEDLEAIDARAAEPSRRFEDFLAELSKNGRL